MRHEFKKKRDISGLRDKYVRRNTYLKYGLFGAIFLIMTSIAWWTYTGGSDSIPTAPGEGTQADSDLTEKRRILNPQYLSSDKKDRPFKVSAAYGEQVSEDIIYLHKPRVDFVLQNGTVGILTAEKGEVNQEEHTLVIQDNVVLEHQSNHKLVTAKAYVNMESRKSWGNNDVRGDGPLGTFHAKGFRIEDEGDTIIFKGPGRLSVSLKEAQKFRKGVKQ